MTPEVDPPPAIAVWHVDPDRSGPMVLEALFLIKNEIDSTLTFRRSCREGACRSCPMNIDGTNHLAGTTFVGSIPGGVRIQPLSSMPVVKDLVIDRSGLFAQYRLIEPWLKAETAPPPARETAAALISRLLFVP